MLESIGDTKIEAINWVQDNCELLRYIAEEVVADAFKKGKMFISEDGIFLSNSEEEFKKNAKHVAHHISQKYDKIHYRRKRVVHKLHDTTINHKLNNVSTNSSNDAASMADLMDNSDIEDNDNEIS